MILARNQFRTLTDDIWAAHLRLARERRKKAAEVKVYEIAGCTNNECPIRTACVRFGRESVAAGRWPGGVDCKGFQPRELQKKEVA